IYWYTAQKQSNGTYRATVSIANHKYHAGEYTVHTYLTGNNGLRACKVLGQGVTVKPVYAKVEAKDVDGKETTFKATVSNAGVFGELNNV
ncbi:GBS Bsp-like repeat-containing protein, partial [Faecalitalea cylindroides]|uniref:GBS Bsp-like repeat-containing protein n=1 Tax=Faecalitalea cylindroides TaxID=39483 RepID=UPI001959B3EA